MKPKGYDELQISEFIKDPTSLKLLILAGTNIVLYELQTIAKCINLIKLDLSANQLNNVSLDFQTFTNLKILYLHDNLINYIHIESTVVEYISLFGNTIQNYRNDIIKNNNRILGIDYNIVTGIYRRTNCEPLIYSYIKWPIVEISHSLSREYDYLNLLKAYVFVINNIYRRAINIYCIRSYLWGYGQAIVYYRVQSYVKNYLYFKKPFIVKVVEHWKSYTIKKRKLRQLLKAKGKYGLLKNKLYQCRDNRSPQVSVVINKFLKSVNDRLYAREILLRNVNSFRLFIPIQKQLLGMYLQSAHKNRKLFFRESYWLVLDKILLYVKRVLFKRKNYDLCDNFDKLIRKTGKSYYILRSVTNTNKGKSFLQTIISTTMHLVLISKGIDRKHILYSNKGHRHINIKLIAKKLNESTLIHLRQKMQSISERIDKIYKQYDILLEYEIDSDELYILLIRILRYFNSGNQWRIMKNQAAYFQTEVFFETDVTAKSIYVGLDFFVRRTLAANTIQRAWRRSRCGKYYYVMSTKMTPKKLQRIKPIQSYKQSSQSVISRIRYIRATALLGHWFRNITFQHRLILAKWHSFTHSTLKYTELFLHLNIYMSLPYPTNYLRYKINLCYPISRQQLYTLLHYRTYIYIVDYAGRKWVKIRFRTCQDAYYCIRLFSIMTYRYYFNGCFIRLFTLKQLQTRKYIIAYYARIVKLFKITIENSEISEVANKINIDNPQPYFIWSEAGEVSNLPFYRYKIHCMPLSIFVYNKTQRPLKINCNIMWISPLSIYPDRKKTKSLIRIKTPQKYYLLGRSEYLRELKQSETLKNAQMDHYIPYINTKRARDRINSMKEYNNQSLLHARRRGMSGKVNLDLLSMTLNIKRK